MNRTTVLGGSSCAALLLLASCLGGVPDAVATDATLAQAEGKNEAAMCQNALDRENPLIVEWPGTHKVELESISKRGIVVVRFTGCKLEVMPRCEVQGGYKFAPVTVQRETLEIKNDADLFSKLPVGSKTLKGELKSGKTLKLDYVVVGQQLASAEPPEQLDDACRGATHYVRTIQVGAYDMNTASQANSGVDVNVGIVEAGAHSSSSRSRLRHSGDVAGCADKKDIDEKNVRSHGCSAPVQLGLAPLPGVQQPPTGPDASAKIE